MERPTIMTITTTATTTMRTTMATTPACQCWHQQAHHASLWPALTIVRITMAATTTTSQRMTAMTMTVTTAITQLAVWCWQWPWPRPCSKQCNIDVTGQLVLPQQPTISVATTTGGATGAVMMTRLARASAATNVIDNYEWGATGRQWRRHRQQQTTKRDDNKLISLYR